MKEPPLLKWGASIIGAVVGLATMHAYFVVPGIVGEARDEARLEDRITEERIDAKLSELRTMVKLIGDRQDRMHGVLESIRGK